MHNKKIIASGLVIGIAISSLPTESMANVLDEYKMTKEERVETFSKRSNLEDMVKNLFVKKAESKDVIKVNKNIVRNSVHEITLGEGQFVEDLSGNPNGYETVRVVTTGNKKLAGEDYHALKTSGIPNIDLSGSVSDAIPNATFSNASHIVSFKFPKELKTIGSDAFKNCTGLSGVLSLPNTLTGIGASAFYGCTEINGQLILPSGLKNIDVSAFYGCTGFTGDLIIPDGVTYIGANAFYRCTGFNGRLTLSSSLLTLGSNAFDGCSGFVGDLIIPNTLKELTNNAFVGCSGFNGRLIIGNSVERIGVNTFSGCVGFTGDLVLPDSLISTSTGSFGGCTGFNGKLLLGQNLESIGQASFSGCTNFTGQLALPSSLKSIGQESFKNCGFTGNLIIPNSLTSMGAGAFSGCSKLDGRLTLGKSLETIPGNAFYNCSGLIGDVIVPEGVVTIGTNAFTGCSGFTGKIVISDTVETIGIGAFNNCSGFKGKLYLGNSLKTINRMAFMGCSGLSGDLIIPDSVITIGDNTFNGCVGFKGKLKLSNSLEVIQGALFRGCSGLTGDLIIPKSVKSIGDYAFRECSNLTGDVLISENVETIGGYVFTGSSKINSIRVSVDENTINSESKKAIINAIPVDKLVVEVPYGFDISGTWLETENKQVVSSVLKFEVEGIEYDAPVDGRADIVYLDIVVSFDEGEIVITKDGKPYNKTPIISSGRYVFKEIGDYRLELTTDLGQTYSVEFTLKNKGVVDAENSIDNLGDAPSVESLAYSRSLVNALPESLIKESLQTRLNGMSANLTLDREKASANLDVYIKCENMLSLSLDTNSVTFDNYSGTEDMILSKAVNLTVNSSLPYKVNAYLESDIENKDGSNSMDISLLNIKASGDSDFKEFTSTKTQVILLDDQPKGNGAIHSIDLKLKGSLAYQADIYKTTIKLEIEQK